MPIALSSLYIMQKRDLSPLIIAFLCLLSAMAIALTFYYILRTILHQALTPSRPIHAQAAGTIQEANESTPGNTSSRNSVAQLMKICKYTDEKKEGDMCAVCLSEFVEGEDIGVLSDCSHTYHVLCIGTWLQSHPNCPLCRTKTVPLVKQTEVLIESSDNDSLPELQHQLLLSRV